MWYKRYGYKQPSPKADTLGCISIIVISLVAFVLALLLSFLFYNPWFFLSIIPLSIFGFWAAEKYALGEGERRRKVRKKEYIQSALDGIKEGDDDAALESLRRANIYGKLPKGLEKWRRERK